MLKANLPNISETSSSFKTIPLSLLELLDSFVTARFMTRAGAGKLSAKGNVVFDKGAGGPRKVLIEGMVDVEGVEVDGNLLIRN